MINLATVVEGLIIVAVGIILLLIIAYSLRTIPKRASHSVLSINWGYNTNSKFESLYDIQSEEEALRQSQEMGDSFVLNVKNQW